MPVLWFQQHVAASEDITNIIKLILIMPAAGQILGLILVIFGILLTLSSFLSHNPKHKFLPDTELINVEQKVTTLPEALPLIK